MANPLIDHEAVILAMRNRLLALSVATTGAVSLSATTTGYARAAGIDPSTGLPYSFITDKFKKGMELVASGFSNAVNNGTGIIERVEALTLTVRRVVVTINATTGVRTVTHPATVAEIAGTRTLAVGLPSFQEWDNAGIDPEPGVPYVDEQYVRGPVSMKSFSPYGRLEGLPQYMPRINVAEGSGFGAATRYADAILALYPPGDKITLPNNTWIQIHAKTAPYAGQLLPGSQPGFRGLLCTIPMEIHAYNSQ